MLEAISFAYETVLFMNRDHDKDGAVDLEQEIAAPKYCFTSQDVHCTTLHDYN